MAQFGPLGEPYVQGDPYPDQLLPPIPQGGLIDVELVAAALGVDFTKQNAFPSPPSAYGFLIDNDQLGLLFDAASVSVGVTAYLNGALQAEGSYLEPNLGQIWPRIG